MHIGKLSTAVLYTMFFIYGCSSEKNQDESAPSPGTQAQNKVDAQKESEQTIESSEKVTKKATCPPMESSPENIQDLLTSINKMPKPITGNCLLESLPRPLYVNATSNKFSAQGATSERSPRIFVKSGNLVMSFVGTGESSHAVELAESINDTMSIKGDIQLPIKENLSPSSPFKALTIKNSASCAAFCHTGYEEVKTWEDGVIEYASSIIFPKDTLITTLDDLKMFRKTCVNIEEEQELCEFYKSLFDLGEVKYFDYVEGFTNQ